MQTEITIVPSAVENFVFFVGYSASVVSLQNYTFNDTVSFDRTLTSDTSDFCGEKTLLFKINGTETTYLNRKNVTKFSFQPPVDTTDFGIGQATV